MSNGRERAGFKRRLFGCTSKICTKCKIEKSVDDFYLRVSSYGQRVPHSICKSCSATQSKMYAKKHPEQRNIWAKSFQKRTRLKALQRYSNGAPICICCGEARIEFLVLDHIHGGGNKHRRDKHISYLPVWLQARKFPPGFQVLCQNCNMAKSAYGQCPHILNREVWPGASVNMLASMGVGISLGEGSTVWAFANVENYVTAGHNVVIGSHSFIGNNTKIGNDVRIQNGAFICRNMVIGDRVFIGPNVTTSDDKWPRVNNPHYHADPPILEDDCNIGAGAILLPGVRIGHHATVGAGAVVTNDVEPYTVVAGCPAREMEVA